VNAEMPGIMGGNTLSRRPEKAAESIQRDSTRRSGSGESCPNTESPDLLTVLRQAARNFVGSNQGSPLQRIAGWVEQGAEKQAGSQNDSAKPGMFGMIRGFPCLHVLNAVETGARRARMELPRVNWIFWKRLRNWNVTLLQGYRARRGTLTPM
jgi:hypothetical protein